MSTVEIGRLHGVNPGVVMYHLRKNGIVRRGIGGNRIAKNNTRKNKTCLWCKEEKSVGDFRRAGKHKQLSSYCMSCEPEVRADWRDRNPEKAKQITLRMKLKSKYGLSMDQYTEMLATQNGLCAVCLQPPTDGKRLTVDHDHVTRRVRALLCSLCNSALSHARDNPHTLRRLAEYVEFYRNWEKT